MERRELEFRNLDALIEDLRGLRDQPYERAGEWSLGQVCEHLRLFMISSMDGFGFRLPWLVRMAGPLILGRTLRRRRIPEGVRGPKPLLPGEEAGIDDQAAVDGLIETVERYRDHAQPLHPSPLFGRMSRDQWDQIHLIHAAHHLSFIVPVRAAEPAGLNAVGSG